MSIIDEHNHLPLKKKILRKRFFYRSLNMEEFLKNNDVLVSAWYLDTLKLLNKICNLKKNLNELKK